MSLSPSQLDARKRSKASTSEPLTLSQALIITAGMAGLLGLCGGAILRFSLANSPDARFLSPLQTFPALSDWAPELPQDNADGRYLPGGGSEYEAGLSRTDLPAETTILTFEPAEPIDSSSSPIDRSLNTEIDTDSKPTDITTFDTFAARENGRQRTAAPLDLLEKGPDLGGVRRQSAPDLSILDSPDASEFDRGETFDENPQGSYRGNSYDDSDRYANDYDEPYSDPYREDAYDNSYPATEEPIDSNDAYYDGEW